MLYSRSSISSIDAPKRGSKLAPPEVMVDFDLIKLI